MIKKITELPVRSCPGRLGRPKLGILSLILFLGLSPAGAWGDQAYSNHLAEARRIRYGDDLCGLLSPEDFAKAGISGAKKPSSNSTPPSDFYCVYAGLSSYKGGIEFDAFVSDSTSDAAEVFKTVLQEHFGSSPIDRARSLGVDQARLELEAKGESRSFATIAVQSGKLVFVIGFPSNPRAEIQLLGLADIVLRRAASLTK
jgi:hypothetical protein